MNTAPLHAYVAAAEPTSGRMGMGVVFVDAQGRPLRRIGRALPGGTSPGLAAFRGIVCALWNSRRLGSRRVVVHCCDRDVVAQINGEDDVPEEYVGPYLEVRALLHAYRAARVEPCPQGGDDALWMGAARDLADAGMDCDVDETVEDLPLWSAPLEERSTA
jgi:hypothetical protein